MDRKRDSLVNATITRKTKSSKWRVLNEFEYEYKKREPQSSYAELSKDVEARIEREADERYSREDVLKSQSPGCSSAGVDRIQSECGSNGQQPLRVKKWTKTQKGHRACRTNDCKFMPKGERGKNLHISSRNYKKILARTAAVNGSNITSAVSTFQPNSTNSMLLTRGNVASSGLDLNLADFLLSLQDREITPEDYEILLQLDQFAEKEKKIKAGRTVKRLASQVYSAQTSYSEDRCVICMEDYASGDRLKNLLCGHRFHSDCLDSWMCTSGSTTCPLDNINIYSMKPTIEGRVSEPAGPLRVVTLTSVPDENKRSTDDEINKRRPLFASINGLLLDNGYSKCVNKPVNFMVLLELIRIYSILRNNQSITRIQDFDTLDRAIHSR